MFLAESNKAVSFKHMITTRPTHRNSLKRSYTAIEITEALRASASLKMTG